MTKRQRTILIVDDDAAQRLLLGGFVAHCPGVAGGIAQGGTPDEAVEKLTAVVTALVDDGRLFAPTGARTQEAPADRPRASAWGEAW